VCVTSVFVNAQDGGGVNVDEAGVVGLILPSRAEALVRARSSVEENLGLCCGSARNAEKWWSDYFRFFSIEK
jgi:hypothetical protein